MTSLSAAFNVLKGWKEESTSLQMRHEDRSPSSSAGGPTNFSRSSVKVKEVSPEVPSFTLARESEGEQEKWEFSDFEGATFDVRHPTGPTLSSAVRVWELKQGERTLVLTEVVN